MENWADVVADRMVGTRSLRESRPGSSPAPDRMSGTFLFLGAADTGKTTLVDALAERLARHRPVALVDADVGQSHIGPPTTVGWTLADEKRGWAAAGWEKTTPGGRGAPRGIAFVGDVTPVGHLLQLLAALALCVEEARQAAEMVLIDTPGLVTGGAACSLWWTVQRLLRPERIVAIQRGSELDELVGGLQAGLSRIDALETPAQLRRKSPEARQEHRRWLFAEYFRDARPRMLSLRGLAVRFPQRMTPDTVCGRIVGLTDAAGRDMALGVIENWQPARANMTVRVPHLDLRRVRCLTIGDAGLDIPFGWSG
jgi:polynucleotide 5'-hydroxyl-kinase GRC3/NOL9